MLQGLSNTKGVMTYILKCRIEGRDSDEGENADKAKQRGVQVISLFTDMSFVSLAHQFTRYTVNCTSRDPTSHLITYLDVYIIARCSSLNTTTFFFLSVLHLTSFSSNMLRPSHCPTGGRALDLDSAVCNYSRLLQNRGYAIRQANDSGPPTQCE